MPRRKKAPTPEEAKAFVDLMDRNGQFNFVVLCLMDDNSEVGGFIKGAIGTGLEKTKYLEKLAGISPEDCDPESILHAEPGSCLMQTKPDKEIAAKLGCSTDAVKSARQYVKKKLKDSVLPPFSAPTR
jgi:hypothetical protein